MLTVEADHVEGFLDADIVATLPQELPVTRVRGIAPGLTRRFGFGGLWLRCGRAITRAGEELLRRERFDLVYFSTTIFSAMTLGPRWLRQFGVPYVIDLQDPWVSDYYARTRTRPPGGHLRYSFAQWQARRSEPYVIREAAHVIAVSPAYVSALRERYPDVPAERFTVLPFAASEGDFVAATALGIRHHVFDPNDGLQHWVYLGRGGADMATALRGLFSAVAELRRTLPRARTVRLHFVGTSYAARGQAVETVLPLAEEAGIREVVSEQTDRIPYLSGLSLLRTASVILVVGSDDPEYSASKIFPCILARRPLLAILHSRSPAANILRDCQAGNVVPFDTSDWVALSERLLPVLARVVDESPEPPSTNWGVFHPFTAHEMTRVQCDIFSRRARQRVENAKSN